MKNNTFIELNSAFRQFVGIPYHTNVSKNIELMGSRKTIRDIAVRAGFRKFISFEATANYPFKTPAEAMDLFLGVGPFREWMGENPGRASEFEEVAYEHLYKCLVTQGRPIGYESIVLIAGKD